MVMDAVSAPAATLYFLVKLVEPELSLADLATEVDYLMQDLRHLEGMRQARLRSLLGSHRGQEVSTGVRFEVPGDRLRAVLQRLCARLDDKPIDTLILMQIGTVKLQIQTRDAEELAGLIAPAMALLPPDRVFLAKAETYARTGGEFSPAELANLDWLRQRLDLSQEDADWLVAKATGPMQSLEEKRRYYQGVLQQELSREYPLSEDAHRVLRELADNLGLPKAVASDLYDQHIKDVQAKVEAQRQQQAEAEAKAAAAADSEQQATTAQQQNQHLQAYRQEFQQAIASSLFPREFDQGRLEQARRLWQLSPEAVEQVEAEVRDQRYGAVASGHGVDYRRLRQLLWAGDWAAADLETERAILSAISQDMQPIDRDAILQLSCLDLDTLDQLWSRYSDGKFGFRAQYELFVGADRRPLDFLKLVDWQGGMNLGNLPVVRVAKPYSELQFSKTAPRGHLPSWRWCCPSLESGYQVDEAMVETLFLHVEKCVTPQLG